MERTFGNTVIELIQGDITKQAVDAIVNAANESLLGGGGVDGAIHRAGGRAILAECRLLNGCPTGDAKLTTAGNLPAKHVIHAVGPVYRDGKQGEPALLASCYRRCIEVARAHNVRSMAFPAISCGVYGYPIPEAARIALETVTETLHPLDDIERIRFVLFWATTYNEFERALLALPDAK